MNKQPPPDSACCLATTLRGGPAHYEPGHYRLRAGVLKALAHPVRLFIVDCLEQRAHCVCELTLHVGLDQSTVSKHLSVLRQAGIVADEKRGREIWYSLRIPCVAGFFSCIEESLRHSGGAAGEAQPVAAGPRR